MVYSCKRCKRDIEMPDSQVWTHDYIDRTIDRLAKEKRTKS